MHLAQFFAAHRNVIHVRLTEVRGSSPRDAGAEMFVAIDAAYETIGGGQLEYMAIDKARALLRNGSDTERMDVPLGPEIGQCCGGRVVLTLERMSETDRNQAVAADTRQRADLPSVFILGAGHVGRALAALFQHLPVRCILIDSRAEELSMCHADVEKRQSVMAEADIRHAPARSAFIVLTHDHALDFLLTSEALDRGDAAYVGLIGSATKRTKFARFHKDHSSRSGSAGLTCPIGASASRNKRPEVIAALVVAEVMTALTAPAHSFALAEN
ncbi:xanthine dehydrogenase accessory protein XdhC [Marivita sp. S2033]|uniref:xanthine dehydrogenase accessory protein XdhC n=1 Tax=Marivita sp. S2033 TaxID=3373187 RepID=UPI0039822EF1